MFERISPCPATTRSLSPFVSVTKSTGLRDPTIECSTGSRGLIEHSGMSRENSVEGDYEKTDGNSATIVDFLYRTI